MRGMGCMVGVGCAMSGVRMGVGVLEGVCTVW